MKTSPRFHAKLGLCFTLACFAAGCQTAAPRGPLPPADPASLIAQYNARASQVTQVWSRAVVQLKWTDEKGKKRSEQGDGHVIFRKPGELAMMIGTKVGDPWVVLGGNTERFWFFDLKPVKGQPTALYFGANRDLGEESMLELNIPVRPDRFINLLGIQELAVQKGQAPSLIPDRKLGGYWYRMPLEDEFEALTQSVLIDPVTALPRSIRITDSSEGVVAEATLSQFEPVAVKGQPPTAWPQVATRIEVHSPSNKTRVILHLSSQTSAKVTDAQFNIESLKGRYKPDKVLMLRPR